MYLDYLKMSSSLEILNNDPKLNNEPIDPSQLSKRLLKCSHKKKKILSLYVCVFEESDLTMSMSTVYL